MSYPSSPSFDSDNDRLNIFNNRSDIYVESAYDSCLILSDTISTIEMFVQEESTGYLDLALISPRCKNWKSFVRTVVQNSLPVPIREFFLAETIDQNQRFTSLYSRVLMYNTNRLEVYRAKLQLAIVDLFIFFENVLFDDEIVDKDDAGKSRNVSKYLRAYKVFQIDRFDMIYPFLIQLCTDTPLDCQLTMDVLWTLCDTDIKKLSVFHLIPSETSLIALIRNAETMRFDFWGMWSGFGDLAFEFDFIHVFMNFDVNQEYSRILLKFGFPYLAHLTENSYRVICLQGLVFDDGSPVVRTVDPLFERATDGHLTRIMLILDTFNIFGDFERTRDIENSVRTLVYLTRTLSEPYVTPYELYATMEKVVIPEFLPELNAIARMYYGAAVFENEHHTYSPRRLMHLCRVVIRKRLARNFKLLHGIEELDIPVTLKSYLKLEC